MDCSFKILVIGNSGVGKTSLCSRYIDNDYHKAYKPTIGVEFGTKDVISRNNQKYTFQFWDIGGQERYIYMTHVYYKNADFCLTMFDLTRPETFKACAKWKQDLDEKYRMEDGSKCPCLLIGNKCDLQNRVLEQSEIEDFCREYDFYGYMEISVKNNIMVKDTIDYVTHIIMTVKESKMKSEAQNETNQDENNNNTLRERKQSKSILLTDKKTNKPTGFIKDPTKAVGCFSAVGKINSDCCNI